MIGRSLFVLIEFFAAPALVIAQGVAIPSTPSCARCTISAERIAVLGRARDSISVTKVAAVVAVDGSGRFYVAELGGNRLLIYDQQGLLLRVQGRRGWGPGEFQLIVSLTAGLDGRVFAFDYGRRVTVIDSTGKSMVGLLPVAPSSAAVTRDGDKILAGMIYSRDAVGFPLQLVTSDGSHVRSFGSREARVDPVAPAADRRLVCCARHGSVWSAQIDRYVLEEWDLSNGSSKRRVERSPDWWINERPKGDLVTSPLSWINGLDMDTRGRLWVHSIRPGKNWQTSRHPVGYMLPVTPASLDAHYESVIEIIDPDLGRVVTSVSIPEYFHGFAAPGMVFRVVEDTDGTLLIEIWKLTLIER